MNSDPKRPTESSRVKSVVQLLASIIIVHFVFAAFTYSKLPTVFPIHFDKAGRPDAFSTTSFCSWLFLWFVSLGTSTLIAWIAVRLDRFPPKYINIPKKEEFLLLSPEARARVISTISFHLVVFTCIMATFFCVLHFFNYLAAINPSRGLPIALVYSGVAVLTAYGIVLTVASVSAVNRELNKKQKIK